MSPSPRWPLALALVWLLCLGATVPALGGGAAGPTASVADTERPRILAAYPNPVAEGDAGEFVVVSGAANLTLSDGEGRVRVPVEGTVALSSDPNRTRNLTAHRVVEVALPSLANGGEVLALWNGSQRLARVEYANAPEAELRRWRYDRARSGWEPLGRTDRPVAESGGGPATVFTLPDAPARPVRTLRAAEERILLAG